jgi:hypothetical protein
MELLSIDFEALTQTTDNTPVNVLSIACENPGMR